MSKRVFDEIKTGVEQAIAIARGEADPKTYRVHVPEAVDVKATRRKLGLSQQAFATQFGFSTAAVRDWEQKRRYPERSARILLRLIDRKPEAVLEALGLEAPPARRASAASAPKAIRSQRPKR
jgi:putative transcriptional regulator